MIWPNKFSRLIGDKTFGLLVAYHLGLPVPLTTVVNRRIAPFGRPTGWGEYWIRTSPPEQMPGLLATHRGWTDPFALLRTEDPDGTRIASVLSQAGVYPAYSGALIVGADGGTIVEGRAGTGESLMVGDRASTLLRPTPGEPNNWIQFDVREFDVGETLPALRALLAKLPLGTGLILEGRVGLTSHVVDVIRKARLPSKML